MRLRSKLLVVHAFVVVVAALAFGQLYVSTDEVADEYRQVYQGILPQVRALEDLRAATAALSRTTHKLARLAALGADLRPGPRREIEGEEARELREAFAAQANALATYRVLVARFAPEDQAFFLGVAAKVRAMVAASREFVARSAAAPGLPGTLAARARLEKFEGELAGAVGAALAEENAALAEHAARTEAAIAASRRLLVLALVLVPLLLLAAGQVVTRAVLRPIAQLTEATARIAAGELVPVAPHRARDEVGRLVAAFDQMTRDLASSQTRARHLALHDALTDLPNRVLLAERLNQALVHARRHGDAPAVLCLDLDRFKEVNDAPGHPVGDLLLREVAARLRACTRETDTVARLGGDEFAVVQVGASQPAEAEALCGRLLEVLGAPCRLDGQEVVVGASVGVALAPVDGDDPATLLRHADIALYRAKGEGRGTFRFFEEDMNRELQARRALERDLRRALDESRFELHYQPQVELGSGRTVGVEALLRWRHPERGVVPPNEFIPSAEETGLIVPIGAWVLRTACAQALAWPGLRVAVNLSAAQFRQPGLAETVAQALRETGLDPGRLELEITEGVLLEDTVTAVTTLHALRSLGVRIAMDDFGTGYSSLSYLRRFPFDKIKIDKSFVADLDGSRSADAAAIVRAVVSLGSSLGMTTTAEGIEAEAQAELLRAEGCDEVQGYHFGRPMPPADLTRWLERRGGAGGGPARALGDGVSVPDATPSKAAAAALAPA
jgi:diguanylate cyclase (GGDEF)-like protein